MLDKVKRLMLYANTDSETYACIYPDIIEENRRNLVVLSMIVCIAMAIMVAASFMTSLLVPNRPVYASGMVLSALLHILITRFGAGHRRFVTVCMYLFIAVVFGFGIANGTCSVRDQITVSLLVMMYTAPLLFTYRPVCMAAAIVLAVLIYIPAARMSQSDTVFLTNMCNVIPYSIGSVIVSTFMMVTKVHGHVLDHRNRLLSVSDRMTNMLNRRSFDVYLSERDDKAQEGTRFFVFDINGLKSVNDRHGHHAGDEVICGAAECIREEFAACGKCYRMGGDEFVVVVESDEPATQTLLDGVNARCARFHGTYDTALTMSAGVATAKRGDSLDGLLREADRAMYAEKKRYHDT